MSDTTATKRGRKPATDDATAEKRVIVSTSLSPELHAALSEVRWSKRIDTMGEVLRLAVVAYIESATSQDTAE